MPTLPASSQAAVYQRPAELLQNLVRFDTTNPPGNERECIDYLNNLLADAGCSATIVGRSPERPNLIARLEGQGKAPPLLLYGHVDVVTTARQQWEHPPFEGRVVGGYLWGRGALDMKGGIVMMLAAFLRARAEGLPLPGDVVLALLSDEEAGGHYGARYLVQDHRHLFEGIRYAIGEFGGFSFYIGRRRFYPIMVAEKQVCGLRATVRGPGGHGSLVWRGGAMARLGQLLQQLERRSLPAHITPVTRQMFRAISSRLPLPSSLALRLLLNPAMTDRVLKLLGRQGQTFAPLFHNTVNATMVRGGDQLNVVPSEIDLGLDGRLLPGFAPADLMAELRRVIGRVVGDGVGLEVEHYDPGPPEPDMGLFPVLERVLRRADPEGAPVPMLLPAVTDGRFFARLGIQTYGFLPMKLPQGFNFSQTIHGPNERIPVDALAFGSETLYELLKQFS